MEKSKPKIFVGFAYKDSEDPYLKQLYSNLEKKRVKIYDFKDKFGFIKANIIHLHWIEYYITSRNLLILILKNILLIPFFFILKTLLRKKIIITLHNISPHTSYHKTLEKLGFKIYLKFLAEKVIVFNEWSRKETQKRYGVDKRKLYKTFPESFIGYYENTLSKSKARKILGIDKENLVLSFVGSMEEYKGIKEIIEFLQTKHIPNLKIILAGKVKESDLGPILRKLEKESKNFLFLEGYIPDKKIQMIINASDAGIFPYNEVTNSGALYLFGSFKKTAVAKNLPVFREVLGSRGYYYEDVKSLVKLITNLDKEDLSKKGEEFYKEIKKNSWKKIVEETIKIYSKKA